MRLAVIGLAFLSNATLADIDTARATAVGNAYNSPTYLNPMMGAGTLSVTRFDRDSITCPTTTLTAGFMPTKTHNDYGINSNRSENYVALLSLNVPLDWGGTITRCKQRQEALIARDKISLTRAKISQEFAVIDACLKIKREKLMLDPRVFPFAKKCQGLLTFDEAFHKREDLNQVQYKHELDGYSAWYDSH